MGRDKIMGHSNSTPYIYKARLSAVPALVVGCISLLVLLATASPALAGAFAETPPSVARLCIQADRMLDRYEYDAALDTVFHGLSLEPTYLPLWLRKARAHLALEQFDEAEQALEVCLLGQPQWPEANLFRLIVTMARKDSDERDKILQVGGLVEQMGPALFSQAVALFSRRTDFPDYLAPLLASWKATTPDQAVVRDALRLFSGGRIAEAKELLARMPATDETGLTAAVTALLDRYSGEDALSLWSVERGTMTRDGGVTTLTAKPKDHALAWLRISTGWKNMEAEVRFEGNVIYPQALFARYESAESYFRLAATDDKLQLHERLPGIGLTNVFSTEILTLKDKNLRLIMRNGRFNLFAGSESISNGWVSISPALSRGRIAISCENPGDNPFEALFANMAVRRIDEHWQALSPDASFDQVAAMAADSEATGILMPVSGDALQVARRALYAGNAGMHAFALLPEGSTDINLPKTFLAGLPSIVEGRVWSGIVFQPDASVDWDAMAEAVAEANASNLRTAVLIDAEAAESLAKWDGDIIFDWILFKREAAVRESDVSRHYVEAMYEDSAGTYTTYVYN